MKCDRIDGDHGDQKKNVFEERVDISTNLALAEKVGYLCCQKFHRLMIQKSEKTVEPQKRLLLITVFNEFTGARIKFIHTPVLVNFS
jgi:hypothetical protein